MGLGSEFNKKGKQLNAPGTPSGTQFLKPLADLPQATGAFCWLSETAIGTSEDIVGELLNAVAIAAGALLIGFNRTGGVNVTIMVGGSKQTYNFANSFDLFNNAQKLCDMVMDYNQVKEPKRLAAAETEGKA